MALPDEIRNSADGRSLSLLRAAAASLRDLGWRTREAATHGAGVLDLAAERSFERKKLETRVHLIIRCEAATHVLFSEVTREVESAIAWYAIGEDLPAPPAAPPARTHGGAFRAEERFRVVVEEAFASIDAVLDDLGAHDREVINDDLEAGAENHWSLDSLARRRSLVHAVIATDALLYAFSDRVTRHAWLRLHRPRVVGAEERWVDVVQGDVMEKYLRAVTRHYERRG